MWSLICIWLNIKHLEGILGLLSNIISGFFGLCVWMVWSSWITRTNPITDLCWQPLSNFYSIDLHIMRLWSQGNSTYRDYFSHKVKGLLISSLLPELDCLALPGGPFSSRGWPHSKTTLFFAKVIQRQKPWDRQRRKKGKGEHITVLSEAAGLHVRYPHF